MLKYLALHAAVLNSGFVLMSASGGGHGSLTDLIWPAVNVLILTGVLVYALKDKLREHFVSYAIEVESTMDYANIRFKEASLFLEAQKKKLSNWEEEREKILGQMQADLERFRDSEKFELTGKIERLRSDATLKAKSEKEQLINQLYEQLVDEIILTAKKSIELNEEYRHKVNSKVLQGIQL